MSNFAITGQYGPAMALIGAGFIGCDTVAAVILLTLAVGLSGASYSAFQVHSKTNNPEIIQLLNPFFIMKKITGELCRNCTTLCRNFVWCH